MCGIAGTIGIEEPQAKAGLWSMKPNLTRRGPDACGYWENRRTALLHTRLRVIDLEGSRQPLQSEDGSVVVVFNGEIYNYVSLREQLTSRGHVFRTQGDTEVLVHLYEEMGNQMCPELDGMFAFAIYDARRHQLLLARDRAGIKPLYYWHDLRTKELLFASDLGALLANPAAPRKLSLTALAQYFQFGYAIHPRTWVEQINQLEPGQLLVWHRGSIELKRHYAWQYRADERMGRRKGATETLLETAGESVKSQLVSDVSLGCFLSGGLDSGTVVALAQRAHGVSGPVNTFTVRFEDQSFDESRRARMLAQALGTVHTEVEAEGLPFDRTFLGEFVDCAGEPFGDVSALPTYALCRDARRRLTVALSGDGGDEIFLGYSGLRKQRVARWARVLPETLRAFVADLPGNGGGALPRRIRKYLRLSLSDDPGLLVEWARRWSTGEISGLMSPQTAGEVLERRHEAVDQVRGIIGPGSGGGFAEQQIRFHLLVDLPCDCLFKVDRMAMAHGLEVRVPLLSNAMLEYAARLPLAMRRRNGSTKEPLRSVAGTLCRELAEPGPKRGFEFPLESWLHSHLAKAWSEWQVTPSLDRLGFHGPALDAMLHQYTTSTSLYERAWLSGRLFDLLLVAVWAEDHRVVL